MSAAQDKVSIVIREAAAEWVARLAAPDLSHDDKAAFAAWLRASPIHVREYLNVEALCFAVKAAVQDDATDVRELLRKSPANVLQPAFSSPRLRGEGRVRGRRKWYPAIAATVLLAACLSLTLYFTGVFTPNNYSTAIGEIRRISLPDGSTLELNTGSKISLDFGADRRDIRLTRGEAFFVVAKDPRRPFRVFSDSAQVRAIGTQFSVYRKPAGTVITVVEGKVAVLPPSALERGARGEGTPLSAGQQIVMAAKPDKAAQPPEAATVDAVRATAWRQKRLIFDNQPLSAVIAEFNRYHRRQLVIEDPELAAQEVSGVFDPDKPQGLLLFLSRKGGVKAIEVSDMELVLTQKISPQGGRSGS